jgi:hypothetical protein
LIFIFHVQCYSRTVISRLLWLTFQHLIWRFHIFQYAWLYFYVLFCSKDSKLLLIRRDIGLSSDTLLFIKHIVLHYLLPINHAVHERWICTPNSHISCFDLTQNPVITGHTRQYLTVKDVDHCPDCSCSETHKKGRCLSLCSPYLYSSARCFVQVSVFLPQKP